MRSSQPAAALPPLSSSESNAKTDVLAKRA
jgi:hypothetical protein